MADLGAHVPLQPTPPSHTPLYRLGFPVKVLGGGGLPSHDSRRWQNQPHLSVSLAYLRDIFVYLAQEDIRFYRMAGALAPYLTHPELPQFHRQLEECALELAALGDHSRQLGLRLTLHPGFFVQLSSPDPDRVRRTVEELNAHAALLDAMGLGPESVIVIHVGGVHDATDAGRARFVRAWDLLPPTTQARLALEHDDRFYSLQDALWIHHRVGVPVVFDSLHHRCLDPLGLSPVDGLRLALATWPQHVKPKIHMSSPRTALRRFRRNGVEHLQAPLPNQHSDFLDPFTAIDLLQAAHDLGLRPFDIMLEAKAKDLALLRLREQLARFAPALAERIR